jgi:hypothetical protein
MRYKTAMTEWNRNLQGLIDARRDPDINNVPLLAATGADVEGVGSVEKARGRRQLHCPHNMGSALSRRRRWTDAGPATLPGVVVRRLSEREGWIALVDGARDTRDERLCDFPAERLLATYKRKQNIMRTSPHTRPARDHRTRQSRHGWRATWACWLTGEETRQTRLVCGRQPRSLIVGIVGQPPALQKYITKTNQELVNPIVRGVW